MNSIEKYWLAVSPITFTERRDACSYIRDTWPNTTISRRKAEKINLPIYKMKKPCKYGHQSWRYVTTQACIQCQRVQDGQRVIAKHRRPKARNVDRFTRQLMMDAPEMIISRDDARAAGMTAYRLGEPCGVCGHATWRYVDSMACVECIQHTSALEPGQDMAFEDSFGELRRTIDTFSAEELHNIRRNMMTRKRKDPRNAADFNRVLRYVKRVLKEREQ